MRIPARILALAVAGTAAFATPAAATDPATYCFGSHAQLYVCVLFEDTVVGNPDPVDLYCGGALAPNCDVV